MQSFTSKQFAYVLEIPEGTTPGVYIATVELTEGNNLIKSVMLNINVEPFSLLDAGKEYITYHTSRRDENAKQSGQYVPEDIYLKQLDDIVAHGLTGVINYEFDPDTINLMLGQSINAGLNKVMSIRHNDITRPIIVDYFTTNGLQPWFYGKDEPNHAEKIDDHINLSDDVHDDGGLVFTAINVDYDRRLSDDIFDFNDPSSVYYDPNTALINIDDDVTEKQPLDMSNISLSDSSASDYFTGLVNDPDSNAIDKTYYWQSMQENPLINRSFTGFFLWNTGMAGVAPYVYSDVRRNPYDDWDVFSNNATIFRDHLTAYPSQEGPVTTIQWEAFREGIDDIRYLQTWKYYYQQLAAINLSAAAVSKGVIDRLLDNYKVGFTGVSVSVTTTAQQFSNDRDTIRTEINNVIADLTDTDGDGVNNAIDNCLNIPNPNQEDTNANGIGDHCEPTEISGFWPGASNNGESVFVFIFGNHFLLPNALTPKVCFVDSNNPFNETCTFVIQVISNDVLIVQYPVGAPLEAYIKVITKISTVNGVQSLEPVLSSTIFGITTPTLSVNGIWPGTVNLSDETSDAVFVFGNHFDLAATQVTISGATSLITQILDSTLLITFIQTGMTTDPLCVTVVSDTQCSATNLEILP